MASYYDDVTGNLKTEAIAIPGDIHQIQRIISDALTNLNAALSAHEAYFFGVETT